MLIQTAQIQNNIAFADAQIIKMEKLLTLSQTEQNVLPDLYKIHYAEMYQMYEFAYYADLNKYYSAYIMYCEYTIAVIENRMQKDPSFNAMPLLLQLLWIQRKYNYELIESHEPRRNQEKILQYLQEIYDSQSKKEQIIKDNNPFLDKQKKILNMLLPISDCYSLAELIERQKYDDFLKYQLTVYASNAQQTLIRLKNLVQENKAIMIFSIKPLNFDWLMAKNPKLLLVLFKILQKNITSAHKEQDKHYNISEFFNSHNMEPDFWRLFCWFNEKITG